ncbi:Protein CBG00846 [Caenorhabditis briggsae]|uniref:Protein CBG00846 n=1 Tax=Caenorhabditis briggsae TaxID=6238 RepID=A8WPH1_CAEBR|nr:Protein CBG00846 [Caenorhabditis briggsae]CAP22378.2 Protein CBG00846 [Caenorhabditis briggsae]
MVFLLLLIFISTVLSSQELYAPPILVGGSYVLSTNYEGAKNSSTGIKRLLNSETEDTWQNGKKIAGANNNVKEVEDGTEISKMQLSDSGRYSRHPSDPVKEALEWVVVSVQEGPKPPPHTY